MNPNVKVTFLRLLGWGFYLKNEHNFLVRFLAILPSKIDFFPERLNKILWKCLVPTHCMKCMINVVKLGR